MPKATAMNSSFSKSWLFSKWGVCSPCSWQAWDWNVDAMHGIALWGFEYGFCICKSCKNELL